MAAGCKDKDKNVRQNATGPESTLVKDIYLRPRHGQTGPSKIKKIKIKIKMIDRTLPDLCRDRNMTGREELPLYLVLTALCGLLACIHDPD
jgi:hypothetical protein